MYLNYLKKLIRFFRDNKISTKTKIEKIIKLPIIFFNYKKNSVVELSQVETKTIEIIQTPNQAEPNQAEQNSKELIKPLSRNESNKYCVKKIHSKSNVKMSLPHVEGINSDSIKNIYDINFIPINIYSFMNVYQAEASDIIYFPNKNKAFWNKSFMKFHGIEMHSDSMIDNYCPIKNEISIYKFKAYECLEFENAISLLGVASVNVTHFITEFIPKLMLYIENLRLTKDYVLLISNDLDSQQLEMVNHFIKNFKKISLRKIKSGQYVSCKNLIYCSAVSHLCNNAAYPHLSNIVIPSFTRKIIRKFYESFEIESKPKRKIYLSRKNRGITNYEEVERFFKNKGYEIIVDSHLLSLKKKLEIFGNATHIAGPGGSAFTFSYFSKYNCKIILFYNYHRAFDTLPTQLMSAFPKNKFTYKVVLGLGDSKTDMNCNFYLPLNEIKKIVL